MPEFSVFAHDPDNQQIILCEGVDAEEAISIMRWAVCDPGHSWVYCKEGDQVIYLREMEERFNISPFARRAVGSL